MVQNCQTVKDLSPSSLAFYLSRTLLYPNNFCWRFYAGQSFCQLFYQFYLNQGVCIRFGLLCLYFWQICTPHSSFSFLEDIILVILEDCGVAHWNCNVGRWKSMKKLSYISQCSAGIFFPLCNFSSHYWMLFLLCFLDVNAFPDLNNVASMC